MGERGHCWSHVLEWMRREGVACRRGGADLCQERTVHPHDRKIKG